MKRWRWPDDFEWPYWEPRDVWVGLFWEYGFDRLTRDAALNVYICLVPCFPMRLIWRER